METPRKGPEIREPAARRQRTAPGHELEQDWPVAVGPRIFLVRHADAAEGPRDHDLGRHLTPLGHRQAAALAWRLAHWEVDAIVCSDKHRSHETARAVHRFHPHVPLIVDRLFREVPRRHVTAHERGDPEHVDLSDRLEAAWNRIAALTHAVTVAVVHSGLIKYFLGKVIKCEGVLKPRFHCTETGITGIQLRPQGPLLEFFNDTHHLSPELVSPGSKVPWIESSRG